MKNIKSFDNFDSQEVVKEHKTLSSLLTNEKVNESVSEDPNEFNLNSILESIKNKNVQIIDKTSKILVLKIGDYDTAYELGPQIWFKWGIKDDMFDSNMIYFVYDFTKTFDEKEHMFVISVGLHDLINVAMWCDSTEIENPKEYLESIYIEDDFEN